MVKIAEVVAGMDFEDEYERLKTLANSLTGNVTTDPFGLYCIAAHEKNPPFSKPFLEHLMGDFMKNQKEIRSELDEFQEKIRQEAPDLYQPLDICPEDKPTRTIDEMVKAAEDSWVTRALDKLLKEREANKENRPPVRVPKRKMEVQFEGDKKNHLFTEIPTIEKLAGTETKDPVD